MAEAEGPWRLLEVCEQRFSQFLHNAQHKHLAWLREVEEQGRRLLESNFQAEPGLMPKKPSQRRHPKKRQSSSVRDESEPTRRRLSRRRSSVKLASSKPGSQRCHSKEQPQNPSGKGEEVSVPDCAAKPQLGVKTELPAPPGKLPAEVQGPVAKAGCDDGPQAELSPEGDGADGGGAAFKTLTGEQVPKGDAATERHDAPAVTVIPGEQTARDGEEAPQTRSSTPTTEAARKRDPATLRGDLSPQDLEKVLFHDPNYKRTATKSKTRRCSGCQSFVGGPHKNRRTSLSEKYSLASKRESMIQKSISRAISKKAAAARESSSASSRVSCQSSLEVFVEGDVTSNVRSGPELNSQSEKVPENFLTSSKGGKAASPPAQHSSPPEQQAGNNEGSSVNPNNKPQNTNQEQAHGAKSQESPSCIWTRSCKQRMGVVRNGQQPGGRAPLEDKHVNSTNQAPRSASPASKVVRPLKNFLQAVQRSQLLASPGPAGHGSVIKNLIKHNTPTRPDPKGDFVKKERQRLESLRKKQEAEEQRRKKVEEEKRRRQAEMKQKREERLRKALQARERVEQLEEEKKKKRIQQKTLQNDEKVRLSQVREERVSEEWSKKKLSKKPGETDAWKQKTLKVEEDEFEQHELLQKRREDKVKEKGKKALELKHLVEQRQVEQVKERDLKQQGGEKSPQPQLEPVVFTEKYMKEEDDLEEPWQQLAEEKKIKQPESSSAASNTCLSKTVKKSISTSCLKPPKSTKIFRSPKVNENNYGMDLNSDDSTDDESAPRKPVPAWADGSQLNQAIVHQYYHPVDVDELFGLIASPKLEDIFGKSKPRYFKRTSSAVWHSPPGTKSACGPTCNFKN
ncbi:inner centromere protein-like isoform X4 [Cygnus olor]|uniref:inner centromere protein-like isoform X4 n=1 Tax=Cygnus olor TaxID=8869 RepID=UPI001ADDF394|nr:inner centromere protein-like isoform X4 [Cygnus olor]